LDWQPVQPERCFYSSLGFRFIGSGDFGLLGHESWTGSIAVFTGWHISLCLPASVYLALFGSE
jgi:hypothetical protein